jgi:hypothetical protein
MHFYHVIYNNWLISFVDLIGDVKQIIKYNHIDITIDKQYNCLSLHKVHNVIEQAFNDEEYDDKCFMLQIEDEVYEGPRRGLYGYIEEEYEEEFYESASYFENSNSPIHLFSPCVFQEFKQYVTTLYKSYFIYHHFNVNISPHKLLTLEYIIRNYDECLDINNDILLHTHFSQDLIMHILTLIYYHYPTIIATDIECCCYQ